MGEDPIRNGGEIMLKSSVVSVFEVMLTCFVDKNGHHNKGAKGESVY
jgi:hypothetical protein